jgi:hypothetical protein
MEFRLNENALGEFEIVQYVPDLVGTFTDQETAEKVLGFLEADAVNATRKAQVAAKESEPKAVPPHQAPSTATGDKPKTAAPAKSDVAHFSWSREDLAAAFERLAKGEKLQVVADDFGKSWTALRAQWAVHNKAQKEVGSPLETLTSVISELEGQVACNLCGHHFTPTDNNADHCARCRADA